MLSRFFGVFSACVITSAFFFALVQASADDKTRIGNETIDRVSVWLVSEGRRGVCKGSSGGELESQQQHGPQ